MTFFKSDGDPVYHHHHLVDGDKEVLGRPYPEHAEVGEHHQVEERQLEEVWEAAMVLIKWGVLFMTSRLFVAQTLWVQPWSYISYDNIPSKKSWN